MPEATIISPMAFRYAGRNPESVTNYQGALLEAATRSAKFLSTKTLRKGSIVLRALGRNPNGGGQLSIQDARTLHPNSSTKVNRWSGTMMLSAGKRIQHGALYVSEDLNGFLNESVRHSRPPSDPKTIPWKGGKAKYVTYGPATRDCAKLLATNVYYVFRLQYSIDLLDLTPERASAFFSDIEHNPGYQAARKDMRIHQNLRDVIMDKFDYTATLPLGLSVLLDHRTAGLHVRTAQNEIDVPGAGFNAVLGGEDNTPLTYLEPAGSLIMGLEGQKLAFLRSDSTDLINTNGLIIPGAVIDVPTT